MCLPLLISSNSSRSFVCEREKVIPKDIISNRWGDDLESTYCRQNSIVIMVHWEHTDPLVFLSS